MLTPSIVYILMKTKELSACFVTGMVDACRDFYVRYFSAVVTFDCGWYVNLRIGEGGASIQFIQPKEGMAEFGGAGIMLNFMVDDVDAEHRRLSAVGLAVVMPLEDHPWGDRAFAVTDPLGNTLYIFSGREPADEFRQFFKA